MDIDHLAALRAEAQEQAKARGAYAATEPKERLFFMEPQYGNIRDIASAEVHEY